MKIKELIVNYTKGKQNVYIIPSKNGFRFIVINFSLFLIAMTYSNNMALLITFIMTTFFILQMFSTHRIINAVKLKNFQIDNNFINSEIIGLSEFEQDLTPELIKYLQCELDCTSNKISGRYHKNSNERTATFNFEINRRGKYEPKRIKFFTFGPTKLFYVWRFFPIQTEFLIYPKIIKTKKMINAIDKSHTKSTNQTEYEQHIRYQTGMSSKRIDWKVYAKSDQLYAKEFNDFESEILQVSYNTLEGDKEKRLSQMSFLINKYKNENKTYKVILPNQTIESNNGQRHYLNSMEAICVY